VLFLSYAEEDTEVAGVVADRLSAHGHGDVYLMRPDEPMPTINQTEERISQAHGYVALLSPDFLTAPLCRRERELAMCREQGLRLRYPDMRFVHVLMVRDTSEPIDGLPPRAEWLDVTDRRHLESGLEELTTRFRAVAGTQRFPATRPGQGSVFFQNRSDELDMAIRGLTNFAGPHFWLVIAPPQLGKTWFLDRLGAMLLLGEREPWVVKLVDVRDQKAEVRTDVGSMLRCLFGPDSPTTPERDTYFYIAQKIIDGGRQHLCMIDSAELLAEDTARTLRVCLSEIHNIVSEAGLAQARFAVVVASRRDNEWRGITPDPRLSILPLTEFTVDVVRATLRSLANEMDRTFDSAPFQRDANRVHRLSEGLPALLIRCIAWIRHHYWVGMERLETEQVFRELAQPYIKNSLLARESLFPLSQGQPDPNVGPPSRSLALEHALRILAPYRLFTQSHLRHYHTLDADLAASMAELNWGVEDLWRAISGSALLTRPLDEPWQQIPAGIRRLLYRHYYPGTPDRIVAHTEARSFMALWADRQSGKEQVIGLVECLWHEAAALRLEQSLVLEADLIESARILSRGLRGSEAYTEDELREFAADRIRRDDEFQETVDDHGLVGRIVAAIVTPQPG
jgi:hypothetical protein